MIRRDEPRATPRRKARMEIEADISVGDSDAESEDEVEVVGEGWPLVLPSAPELCSFA